MSVELIISIALIFFVLLSVAAGVASLYLLKVARERGKSRLQSEQSAARVKENVAVSEEDKIDIESLMSILNTGSLAAPDVRAQVNVVAKTWRHVMPVVSYSEWQRAMEAGKLLNDIRRTQRTLDLAVPHIDYKQIISRARSEDIEDLFHDHRPYGRTA